MQTFLPYPNFVVSARCLDDRRLGKQRVEAHQILDIIGLVATWRNSRPGISVEDWRSTVTSDTFRESYDNPGWCTHPAVVMWRNHRLALMLYHDVMIREWVRRGFNNDMHCLVFRSPDAEVPPHVASISMPGWLGREDVHASHRANLLRKDPEHYGQFSWDERPQEGYEWPTD